VKVEKHQSRWQLTTLDNCKIQIAAVHKLPTTKKVARNAVNMRSDALLAFSFYDISPVLL